MAVEWAADGVRVNAVAPGVIESSSAAANYSVDVFEAAKEKLPPRRTGIPEEVSSSVCFMLSPAASFISGTVLKIDCAGSLYSPLFWQIDGMSMNMSNKYQEPSPLCFTYTAISISISFYFSNSPNLNISHP
jgi:hypothetical protein